MTLTDAELDEMLKCQRYGDAVRAHEIPQEHEMQLLRSADRLVAW